MAQEKRERRRRESELKEAIYTATVELLENKGYKAVTFQHVAQRAHTTRSVLYRYWEDTFELIFEAARYHVQKSTKWHGSVMDQEFNSKNLRTDLINMITYMRGNSQLYPKNFLSFIFFEQSQGRKLISGAILEITDSNLIIIERILARAQERGEATENIGRSAKLLPFQISRYHIMFDGTPMSDKDILTLVDEVLLPIYTKKE